MNKDFYRFDRIYIEEEFRDHPNVKRVLSRVEGEPEIEYTDTIYSLIKGLPIVYHPRERAKSLYLGGIRGEIFRSCPGTQGHLCCNYHVINLYIGCPIDCSYCILQAYLNQPFTIINVDIEKIFAELDRVYEENPGKTFRIGTGELGDSLVYDHLTGFSRDFLDYFAGRPEFIFEFKTKTNYIESIVERESPGNIVVGFSVNPQSMISREELYAATISQRMEAAARLVARGYKVALHFDPIINIDNFDKEYGDLIDFIFSKVKGSDIAWISLGTFRYTPDLKSMVEYNYSDSKILDEEFIESADRKFRYFKPIREELYQKIVERLRAISPEMLIYLCMESPSVWQNCLGFLPYSEQKMDSLFKRAASNRERD